MDIPIEFLQESAIVFVFAIAVLLACHYLRIPSLVGFILTGVLSGPHGFSIIANADEVEILARLGVILLLFIVGMEFSKKDLIAMKREFFFGGMLQVAFTFVAGMIVSLCWQRPIGEAIFFGCLIALSSTAIALKILHDRGEEHTPHGRTSLAICIFQDVISVPMVLIIPLLGGITWNSDLDFFVLFTKGLLILLISLALALKVIPTLFFYVTKTGSRELFLISVLAVCSCAAWIASIVGLPLPLGAFLAGLILSSTEYRFQAKGTVLPFQDVFASVFFISIGMLLDLNFAAQNFLMIILLSCGVLLLKTFLGGLAMVAIGMPLRTAILVGATISQIGEFSFVLAKVGFSYNLGMDYFYQLFLSITLFTMAATSLLMKVAPGIAEYALKLPIPNKIKFGWHSKMHKHSTGPIAVDKKDHVVIVGFGISGRHLARTCQASGIVYAILELNPETVKMEKAKGEPIFFGDAANTEVLTHANIAEARVLAVLMDDPNAMQRIVKNAKLMNEHLHIVVRTRYLREENTIRKLGADEVVTDEFESSIEVFKRVLIKYAVSPGLIEKCVRTIRG